MMMMNITNKHQDDEYDIYDDDSQLHLPIPDLSLVTARIDNEGTEVQHPPINLIEYDMRIFS